jgi:hypothetical protein
MVVVIVTAHKDTATIKVVKSLQHQPALSLIQAYVEKIISPNVGLEPTTLRLRVSCSTD